ncbi:MAG: hypothetical protein JXA52_02455 [Planctomycetes bacterium]|nr:hypothetical protein [Planctomycetota bacterium]
MKPFQIILLVAALLFTSAAVYAAEDGDVEAPPRDAPPQYSLDVVRGQRQGVPEEVRQEMQARIEETRKKQQEIQLIVKQINATEDAEQKQVLTRVLRGLVEESFDQTTTRREEHVAASEKRLEEATKHLAEAKASLELRKQNREKHIDKFVEKLLTEDPAKILRLGRGKPEAAPELPAE